MAADLLDLHLAAYILVCCFFFGWLAVSASRSGSRLLANVCSFLVGSGVWLLVKLWPYLVDRLQP